ncbi:calcium-binding protein [Thetidibacter halocola]|uniref:Calcium-binding protein n=1 Tax=Thetidibacter halocola TaxID=2827239 RepID=A0A8J8B8K8_9RHOB|nr:calcium-binding protein [Thetidibacter halocola]MBS0124650.1 hypothetical protein [Thetidibacter halocola]
MTTTFITSTLNVSGVAATLDGNDTLLVARTGQLLSSGDNAVEATGFANVIQVDGYVAAFGAAIRLGTLNGTDTVGAISVGSSGVVTSSDNAAIVLALNNGSVTNAGSISARNGVVSGFFETARADLTVSNSGTMAVRNHGVLMVADSVRVSNSGTIAASDSPGGASTILGAFGNTGVSIRGSNSFVSNSGSITSPNEESFGVGMLGDANRIINSGVIQTGSMGETHAAVLLSTTAIQSGRLDNMAGGTIAAPGLAVRGGLGAETVVNAGHILGTIRLAEGTDVVTNSGQIDGTVDLGAGDDRYDASGGGLVVGSVFGGLGFDFLRGSAADDSFFGEDDSDFLSGRGGDDTLNGGAGDDAIYGGAGEDIVEGGDGNDNVHGGADNDTVRGGNGDDALRGGGGDDLIEAGTGRDTLWGGDGDDTMTAGAGGGDTLFGGRGDDVLDTSNGAGWDRLEGGAGDDTMTSGGGNDVFVFRRGMGHDVITDFANNFDRLDISALGIASYAVLTGAGAISGDATQTVINFAALGIDGTITLDGFDRALMNAADFIF